MQTEHINEVYKLRTVPFQHPQHGLVVRLYNTHTPDRRGPAPLMTAAAIGYFEKSHECLALPVRRHGRAHSLVLGSVTRRQSGTKPVRCRSRCSVLPFESGTCRNNSALSIMVRTGRLRCPLPFNTLSMCRAGAVRSFCFCHSLVLRTGSTLCQVFASPVV